MFVTLLQNIDIKASLVNGSTGKIIGREKYDYEKVRKAKERDPTVATVGGGYGNLKQKNIEKFIDRAAIKEWPIFNFDSKGGTRTIYAECTVNELGDEKPYSQLSRTQIPLMAGGQWRFISRKA
jgi:ATP-dependent DNA helicase PIF1